ncbi:SDR family oxidoreductase [Campylobacterota bacterium DY0563]
MSYILILGAKSDIGKSLARTYSKNGYDVYLAGRDIEELSEFSNDLKIRYEVNISLKEFDITDFSSHHDFYNSLDIKPLGVIVVAGFMAEQSECEKDWEKSLNTINVNYTGVVSILNIISNDMGKNRNGFIVGVSSVAGDRGRKANYIYGSSKAAFSTYLSGLRNRLYESKVQVLTVKPGFVNTKMTQGMDLPEKLTSEPEEVAEDIFKAQQKGKNILYTKRIWLLIMFIIKHIPETIFKRLSI